MSCLSNEEVIDALIGLVANDMYNFSVSPEKKPVNLEEYIKNMYSFVKENSQDEATAVTAAMLTPYMMDRILSARSAPGQLTSKIPDGKKLRKDLIDLLELFEDVNNVREFLGLTETSTGPLQIAQEVASAPKPPAPESPEKPEMPLYPDMPEKPL